MKLVSYLKDAELCLQDIDNFTEYVLNFQSMCLNDALKLGNEHLGEAGFVYAIGALASDLGLNFKGVDTSVSIRDLPVSFSFWDRQSVFAVLGKMALGTLYTSDTYAIGHLKRAVQGIDGRYPLSEDRFVALNVYANGKKADHDVLHSPFVMIEIDDPELSKAIDDLMSFSREADLSPLIFEFAEKHMRDAQRALSFFTPKDYAVPPPFYACYTGNKSIHFLWRFDKALTPKERALMVESKRALIQSITEAKAQGQSLTQDQKCFDKIDPDPLFSGTAMVRVPCNAPEWSEKIGRYRNPQAAWNVTDSPQSNADTLPSAGMIERATIRLEEVLARLMRSQKYMVRDRRENAPLRNVSREEVSNALGKA
jgi:hypothetical protein